MKAGKLEGHRFYTYGAQNTHNMRARLYISVRMRIPTALCRKEGEGEIPDCYLMMSYNTTDLS